MTLGRVVLVTRGVGLALTLARCVSGGSFGGCGFLQRGLRRFALRACGFRLGAGDLQFGFDVVQTRALGEAAGGAGRRMRGGGKAVPAPQVAFRRHQALAGL